MNLARKRLHSYLVAFLVVASALTAAPAANAAGPYLLNDHPGAKAAYSLRKLSTSYSGAAIRVHRTSDGAEQDIGFVNDQLDVAALTSFAGSNTVVVVTWYSQVSGVPHAKATAPATAPIIARNGSIVRDEDGNVAMQFVQNDNSTVVTTHLRIDSMPSYSSQDLLVFMVMDPNSAEQAYPGTAWTAQKWGEKGHLATRWRMGEGLATIEVGDGSNATRFDEIAVGQRRGIFTLVASNTKLELYRNHVLQHSGTHSRSAYSTNGMVIGAEPRDGQSGFAGFISEMVIYPISALAQRESIYRTINGSWHTGPDTWNAGTLLPQDWPYQVTLYNWLKTLTVADVSVTPAPLKWDGTYTSVDQLANLWLSLKNRPQPEKATLGKACWYVLDDGNGCGIEATGEVRLFYKGGDSNTGAYGNDPAFWYQLNVPLSGGGQGNPYYNNSAVARRALAIAMTEMMMWDRAIEEVAATARNDFYGKALSSWAYIYRVTRHLLTPEVQAAFEEGMGHFLDYTILLGAHDVNTNMDMYAVHGAALAYASTSNATLRSKAIRAAKRILFGYEDGQLGTKHDVDEGTFFPAGYIGEADGPEITYNGHSLAQLVGALSYVHQDAQWDFLRDVVARMASFKLTHYFPDPGVGGGWPFYDGPAGYANRTGGSYVRDQGGSLFRDLTVAAIVPEARPLIRPYLYENQKQISSVAEMASDIGAAVLTLNQRGFSTPETGTPPAFKTGSSWPADRAYLPPDGWYGQLTALLNSNDPTTFVPYSKPGPAFSVAFGGAPTGDEFWAYRNTDNGGREFGFFIEADARQGNYNGWYGGKVEIFWTRDTGRLVLNRHDKTGCDPAHRENSTCWDQVDYWAATHVWGRDENGSAFSTSQISGRDIARTSDVQEQGATPYAEVVNYFNDPKATGNNTGEQTGTEISGSFSVTNRFEALSNGLRVRHIVASDQTDQFTELWATIPVYLRYNYHEQGGQSSLNDSSIEYWDGSTWRTLTTSRVATSKIRIGRDYKDGKGPRYGYVGFWEDDGVTPRTRFVKLSSQVWEESYQGYSRIRNVHIDLHGTPGSTKTLAATTSVIYSLQTTDPGAAPDPGPGTVNQEIQLDAGWNYVSRHVQPEDARFSTLVTAANPAINVVRSNSGQEYQPAQGIDNLGEWDATEAYEIFATSATTIQIEGQPIDPVATAIPLETGSNLVPYLLNSPLSVEEALASILADIVLVKDAQGNVYNPAFGINTLGQLQPGKGYKILVKRAVTLTYPSADQLP